MEEEIQESDIQPESHPTQNDDSAIGTPEIEEIISGGESNEHGGGGDTGSSNGGIKDVYVAVGKDDLEVLRWALHHVIFPGNRVNLIHVFPPLSSVHTPVGRLWVGQLGPEQVRVYASEEHNRRRSMLHKYIQLCVQTKVDVDTIIIESTETTRAILDLIPVLHITSLVMGAKQTLRRLIKGVGKGTLIQRSAPDYCKVILVSPGKKPLNNKTMMPIPPFSLSHFSSNKKKSPATQPNNDKNFGDECRCFPSVKFSSKPIHK